MTPEEIINEGTEHAFPKGLYGDKYFNARERMRLDKELTRNEHIVRLEELWKREELLAEKHKKLQPCIERGLKIREDFIAQDTRDEDMIFTISTKENNLIRDIYGSVPIMFIGMNIKVA